MVSFWIFIAWLELFFINTNNKTQPIMQWSNQACSIPPNSPVHSVEGQHCEKDMQTNLYPNEGYPQSWKKFNKT